MKEFYTYEQQLEKLRKDGLIIVGENEAIDFLRLEGYYNVINGYASTFKVDNKFCKGITFDDIRYLYDFDKSLRSIVYKYTSSIETHIKALIAHEFSRVHGVDEKAYLQKENFTQNGKAAGAVARLIDECNSTISEALNRNSNKYRQYNYSWERVGVYRKITAEQAYEMMNTQEVTIVDVRTQSEYDEGHIQNAVLIPNETIGSEPPSNLPDKNAVILVYCRSGRRSEEAARKLVNLGYVSVYDFGGINDWTYGTVKD